MFRALNIGNFFFDESNTKTFQYVVDNAAVFVAAVADEAFLIKLYMSIFI